MPTHWVVNPGGLADHIVYGGIKKGDLNGKPKGGINNWVYIKQAANMMNIGLTAKTKTQKCNMTIHIRQQHNADGDMRTSWRNGEGEKKIFR